MKRKKVLRPAACYATGAPFDENYLLAQLFSSGAPDLLGRGPAKNILREPCQQLLTLKSATGQHYKDIPDMLPCIDALGSMPWFYMPWFFFSEVCQNLNHLKSAFILILWTHIIIRLEPLTDWSKVSFASNKCNTDAWTRDIHQCSKNHLLIRNKDGSHILYTNVKGLNHYRNDQKYP